MFYVHNFMMYWLFAVIESVIFTIYSHRNERLNITRFESRNPGTNYTVTIVAITEMSGVGMQQVSSPASLIIITGALESYFGRVIDLAFHIML